MAVQRGCSRFRFDPSCAPTFLPLSDSALSGRAADLVLNAYQSRLSDGELASRGRTSAGSLSRLFPAETGLTFKAWRQWARLVYAMDRLARGEAVAVVSAQTGFASTGESSSAFRQVTAMTPNAFLERPDALMTPA